MREARAVPFCRRLRENSNPGWSIDHLAERARFAMKTPPRIDGDRLVDRRLRTAYREHHVGAVVLSARLFSSDMAAGFWICPERLS
jgi:hypothetical protein